MLLTLGRRHHLEVGYYFKLFSKVRPSSSSSPALDLHCVLLLFRDKRMSVRLNTTTYCSSKYGVESREVVFVFFSIICQWLIHENIIVVASLDNYSSSSQAAARQNNINKWPIYYANAWMRLKSKNSCRLYVYLSDAHSLVLLLGGNTSVIIRFNNTRWFNNNNGHRGGEYSYFYSFTVVLVDCRSIGSQAAFERAAKPKLELWFMKTIRSKEPTIRV